MNNIGQNGNDGDHYERVAIKDDGHKAKLGLIDPAFLEEMSWVLQMGEEKYGPGNWLSGLNYSRLIDAAKRHLTLGIEMGEDIDQESGEYHAVHVATCMMFLAHYMRNKREELDDRRFKARNPQVQKVRKGVPTGALPQQPTVEVGLVVPPVLREGEERKEDPIKGLQERIANWANKVFPGRSPTNALRKLLEEEIPELMDAWRSDGYIDPEELADVFILVIDIAYLLHIDILSVAHMKMGKNERRKWAINPATGLMNHVKENNNG